MSTFIYYTNILTNTDSTVLITGETGDINTFPK